MYLCSIIMSMLVTYLYAQYQCKQQDRHIALHYGVSQTQPVRFQIPCSHVGFYWFIYALRAQSLIILVFSFAEIKLAQQSVLGIAMQAVAGGALFCLSFMILRGGSIVWFLATLLTCNPFFWLSNTRYYLKNRDFFHDIS
ncbi:hypothetical protein [uncultured Shewanella sp.]|uniref:hypothetical protein n=1 Tax=uncultured Shewanella sp. TaxID=173975 RepID=UPI00260477DB|nr:hypothetical protein [uncultured Shewanella sp.]